MALQSEVDVENREAVPHGSQRWNTVLSNEKTGSPRWFTPVLRANARPQPGRDAEARLSVSFVLNRTVSPA